MAILVEVEKAEPGMVLAEPVLSTHGQVILPAGAKLTFSDIKILKNWGIRTLKIGEGEEAMMDSPLSEEAEAEASGRVRKRMYWQPSNPVEEEIYRMAVKRAAGRTQKEKKE